MRSQTRMIARTIVSAAIVFGTAIIPAAPTGADPSPFNTLSCNCPQTSAPGSKARHDGITQGLRTGLSAWSRQAS